MNFGKIQYFTHSSKTKCVFVDNKDLPLISLDIWCKAGSSLEDVNKNGTAHFLEHMIFKGTNKLMPGEFDHKIESLGGISNASTGYDDVHYHVLIPPHNFKESLALLTNIVISPILRKSEFEKEKSVVLDEIKQQNDQPDETLFNYFLKRIWENGSYGKSILGTEESIKLLEIDDLKEFHKRHYVSDKVCIAVVGNLSNEIFKSLADSDLSGISEKTINVNKSLKNLKNKHQNIFTKKGKEVVVFENLEFSRILMAWNIPGLEDQRKIIGFEVLSSILSVGRNSKLVKVLREEKNIVESIYVDVNGGELGSLLIIEACCENKNLDLVENQINEIIHEITSHKNLTSEELKKAINIVKSNYIFNLETPTQISSFLGNELLWGRRNSIKNIDIFLDYWKDLSNFKEITNFLKKDNFTLIASPRL